MVKLEGESDWVPAGIKNDGTLCIARDSFLVQEIFTILTLKDDDGTHFTYANEKGERRHLPFTKDGYFVFELEKGSYLLKRNYLEVFIDNILRRDVASGALTELTEKRFSLNESLETGQKIYVRYLDTLRIGNPYPRMFLNNQEPSEAEEGDFWLNQNLNESDSEGDSEPEEDNEIHVSWDNIDDKPDSLKGYGIRDNFSRIGHLHHWADIVDAPDSMAANGGNADTVGNCMPGTGPNNVLKLDADGKFPATALPDNYLTSTNSMFVQTGTPKTPQNGAIWFDTTAGKECIKAFVNGKWITFGAVWKE